MNIKTSFSSLIVLLVLVCPNLTAQFQFADNYRSADELKGIDLSIDFEHIPFPIASWNWILNIYEDSKGYIWVRMGESGCVRYDGRSFSQIDYKIREQPAHVAMYIHDVLEDQDGSHWLCTAENMLYYNHPLKLTEFKAGDFLKSSHNKWEKAFFNMEKTSTGHLLIGTKAGLLIYDIASDQVEELLQFAPYREDAASSNNHIRHITADPTHPHLFWCTTRAGFFLFDLQARTFTKVETPYYSDQKWDYYSFRYNELVGKKLFSVVLYNHLMGFDTQTRQWEEIGHWADPTNARTAIYDIKPLEDSLLFLSVKSSGQFLVDPIQKIYYPLQLTLDGEQPPTSEFWGFCVDKNGYLWTSTKPGMLLRSKKPILKKAPATHALNVQRIFINGTEIDYSRLKDHHLALGKEERNLKIKYQYINPNPDRNWSDYYRLKGHSNNWKQPQEGWIEFQDLRAGTFVLETQLRSQQETISNNELQLSVASYWYEKTVYQFSGLFILAFAGFIGFRLKKRAASGKEKNELTFEKKLKELEMKALTSQMDPQFIFSSLSSIKQLIQEKREEKAIHYLTQFSKFVRQVLNHSETQLIRLDEEIEMSRLYLEMEKLRFEQTFQYKIEIDKNADPSFVSVPPLTLHPFLENAIWKGLRYKVGERMLRIQVKSEQETMKCIIEDNGIKRDSESLPNDKKINVSITQGSPEGTRIELTIEL